MSWQRIIGIGLIALPLVVMFAGLVAEVGWRVLIPIGGALLGVGSFALGMYLLAEEDDETKFLDRLWRGRL